MKKSNQIQSVEVSASAVPERVSVAMSEIAENMSEGLLALAVGAGLQVMAALMDPRQTHPRVGNYVTAGEELRDGKPLIPGELRDR